MTFHTRFVGSNVLVNELGAEVKEMRLDFNQGEPVIIARGATGTVLGECYQIIVTFNDTTVRRYNATNNYTFNEHVASKARMLAERTRVSIISDSGIGGNFELVTRKDED